MEIVNGILLIIGTILGVLAGVWLNNQFIIKSADYQFFGIAKAKFRSAMMPFYNEISKMADKNNKIELGNNNYWSCFTMPKIIPEHRKVIDEFRFSIPIKQRHGFDVIADAYCPPQETYNEDKIKEMYWSDENMEREMQIRQGIKNNIEKMMDFNI